MMRQFSNFLRDQRGTAAIEFGFVVPILITLCLGMFEVSGVISASMKLANTAQMMGDLVSQQTNETNTMTTNFCNGGKMVMSPLSTGTLKITIASVTHKAAGTSVDWQDTTCGGASTISNGPALAASITPSVNDSVIIVVATYQYTSPLTHVLSSSYTLTRTTFSRPRDTPNVTHS